MRGCVGVWVDSGAGGRYLGSCDIYLTLHCQHQNDSVLIKTGSGESHLNVSNVVKRSVTRLSLNHSYLKRTESRSVHEPTSV